MNKNYFILLIFVVIFGLFFVFYNIRNNGYVRQQLDAYAQRIAERQFGSMLLAPKNEKKIVALAQEMKVTEPIFIRKMNYRALSLFGYYNAFAYFPLLFGCIPIGSQAFLFISEGFFEDLLPEEQRFLIGHEMVHIKEHHTQYLNLVLYILFFMLLFLWWFTNKYISKIFTNYRSKYHTFTSYFVSLILFGLCLVITDLVEFSYRRHIEREADCVSISILNSYDGGIKLMDRWQQEFGVPMHNPNWGLFSNHPSCHERKMYCINIKNNNKGKL